MLCYHAPDMLLAGYTDADWGGDPDERKSTSSYVFLLNDRVITWYNMKQTCVALSTMEVEYVVCFAAVQEGFGWKDSFESLALSHVLRSPALYIVIVQLILPTLRTPSIMEKSNT